MKFQFLMKTCMLLKVFADMFFVFTQQPAFLISTSFVQRLIFEKRGLGFPVKMTVVLKVVRGAE